MRLIGGTLALVLIHTPMLVTGAGADEPSPVERIEAETHHFVWQCLDLPDPISCVIEHGYQCLSISDSDEPKLSCLRRYPEGSVILTVWQDSETWRSRFSWHPSGKSHPDSIWSVEAKLAQLLEAEDNGKIVRRLMSKDYSQSDSRMIAGTAFRGFAKCLVGAMRVQAALQQIPPELFLKALESKIENDNEYRLEDLMDWPAVQISTVWCNSRVWENIGLLSP